MDVEGFIEEIFFFAFWSLETQERLVEDSFGPETMKTKMSCCSRGGPKAVVLELLFQINSVLSSIEE